MKFPIASAFLMGISTVSASSLRRVVETTTCPLVLEDILFSTACTGASVLADVQTAMDDAAGCNSMGRNARAMQLTNTATLALAKAALREECENDRTPCISGNLLELFPNCEMQTILESVQTKLAEQTPLCDHGWNVELMLHTDTDTNREAKTVIQQKCLDSMNPCLGSLDNLSFEGATCKVADLLGVVETAHSAEPTCTHSVFREIKLLTETDTNKAAKQALVEKCIDERKPCTQWADVEIPSCKVNQVIKAIRNKMPAECSHGLNGEINLLFGTDSREEAEEAIKFMCDESWDFSTAPTNTFASIDGTLDDTFMTEYTKGDTFLNLETGNFRGDDNPAFPAGSYDSRTRGVGQSIKQFRRGDAKTSVLKSAITLDTCAHNAMMCCFKRDRQSNDDNGNCADDDCDNQAPGDNSQLCDVTEQDDIHCHGLAWDTNPNSPSSTFKLNNFFFVSLFDHMYTRGYVENVLDTHPMCGCIEEMPKVSRSDCTQIDVQQVFVLNTDTNGYLELKKKDDDFAIKFNACQGINPNTDESQDNDLTAHVNRMVKEGRLTDAIQDKISATVVGGNNDACE